MGRFKRAIGDGPRSRTGRHGVLEMGAGVHALDRVPEPGGPRLVRTARHRAG